MRQLISYFFVIFIALIIAQPAYAEKRLALVIGNSAYQNTSVLPSPGKDAKGVAAALKRLGFEVIGGRALVDLDKRDMSNAIRKFSKKLRHADVGLFYYSGHGIQVGGKNYVVPVDAPKLEDEADVEYGMLGVRDIIKLMERGPRTNFVFLDACRDNPLGKGLAKSMGQGTTGKGFVPESSGSSTLIAFATAPGQIALASHKGLSPFTKGLLNHIETPGLEIDRVLRRVRLDVMKLTHNKQRPWTNSSLTVDQFFFKEAVAKPEPKRPTPVVQAGIVNRYAIEALLKQAGRQISKNRLSLPEGDNAYETYQTVLKADPGNEKAKVGLEKIVDSYVFLFLLALDENDKIKSKTYYNRAVELFPGSEKLKKYRMLVLPSNLNIFSNENPNLFVDINYKGKQESVWVAVIPMKIYRDMTAVMQKSNSFTYSTKDEDHNFYTFFMFSCLIDDFAYYDTKQCKKVRLGKYSKHIFQNGNIPGLAEGYYFVSALIKSKKYKSDASGTYDNIFSIGNKYNFKIIKGQKNNISFNLDPWQNVPACPWIYIFDGQRYVKRMEIIQNLSSSEQEGTQNKALKSVHVKNGIVKIRISEEKKETSFVNYLALQYGGKTYLPLRKSKPVGNLTSIDKNYLILNHGDTYDVEFDLSDAIKTDGKYDMRIISHGYYDTH